MYKSISIDPQLEAWKSFILDQSIQPGLSMMVAHSWQRCWTRLNPHQIVRPIMLSRDHLLAAQVASFDLISVARPVMEDMYQFIEDSETVLALVNGAGYIMDLIGDEDFLGVIRGMGIETGASISETQIGTNAFSLALLERFPSLVCGAEHFLEQYHFLADGAAPIFDPGGRVLGAMGAITSRSRSNRHLMGMVVAGARAIEGQRQSDVLLAEQNSHLAELYGIMSTISEGIVVWNSDRVLVHINPAAAEMSGLPNYALVGRRIKDILSYPPFVQEALDNQEPLTDVEATLQLGQRTLNCILSLRFVKKDKELQWIVAYFRREREVHQLVHRQLGASAVLTIEDLLGESPEIRRVRRLVKSAAGAQASVMIRGESGTGKNVVASAIHNESPRRDGPFLIFTCSSVPNELVMAELVGYAEDYSSKKPGGRPSKFELAHGGTLFFQDVDGLPLEAQVVLLNVLELGIVQRLGSDRAIPVDVRVVAASTANMEKLIAQGNFRADLFYRLSPFEISLPALRERPRDLPLLVERILNRLSRQLAQPLKLEAGVIELLSHYPWPGNVRELEAVLGRAAAQAGGTNVIEPIHLPQFIQKPLDLEFEHSQSASFQSLNQIEREAMLRAVELCKGNLSRTADLLGVGRTTIWRKLKAYNISAEDYRGDHLK